MKFSLALIASVLAAASVVAQEEDPTAKFREALRNTMLQLRDAQAKTAEMEASMVQSQLEADKLKKEVSGLQAQLVEERSVTANVRSELDEEREASAVKSAKLVKWEEDYRLAVNSLRKAEHANAQAKARITVLERAVNEQQVKNLEMKATADEILDRYQRHSLGTTILAREPFISVNRAKLQTIMQDLETRIRAAGIRSGEAPAAQPSQNP